jgi:hypothetical protein
MNQPLLREKLTTIYSERRAQEVAVRIHWAVLEEDGTTLIELRAVQEYGS